MNLQEIAPALISSAVKAPSGHNTQPWIFQVAADEIQIRPDFSRALPVVDPDNHALYISLGCAAENLVIAASQHGLNAMVSTEKSADGGDFIRIRLTSDPTVKPDDLFAFLEKRQSTRNEYEARPVPATDLEALKTAGSFRGIALRLFIEPTEINALEPFIREGSDRQFGNEQFVKELTSWVRFTETEAEEKRDGLWVASMGLPPMGRFFGSLLMGKFITAESEEKRWHKLIQASAGFALFIAEQHDEAHWANLGRAFERFALTATKLGISHAHVNMPCEEPEVRRKLAAHLNLSNQHPLLLIRFGYSEPMPYSKRRNVEEVMR